MPTITFLPKEISERFRISSDHSIIGRVIWPPTFLVSSSEVGVRRAGVLIRVIMHPSYSGTVLLYTIILACHPFIAPFTLHSQQYAGLNNKSYGHPTSEGYED